MGRFKVNINESAIKNQHLYFLSKDNMNDKTLYPRIPENYFTKNGYEDKETKRVCFAHSINKALMGISIRVQGMELYVHVPKESNIKTYNPNSKEVPDCKITGETWVTDPVQIKCIGKIRVIDDAGKEGHPFKYGDKTAELYDWTWEWIEKYKQNVNEGVIISDKDFSNNLEKWENGKYPVLLITGLSGGGKTTLANNLASKYKADLVELDQIEYDHTNSKNNFLEKFMNSDPKYHKYRNITEYWKDKNGNTDKDKLIKTLKEFIHFCVSYAIKNNIKTIIEGIQIYQLMYTKEDLIYMTDKPIIIIGTSPLVSKLRQFKRILTGGNGGQTLKTLIQDNNYLKEFRDDIKSTIKEDTMLESYILNDNDIYLHYKSWKKERGKNVLFITGLSGSGKTTLGEKIEKENHAHLFEIDGIEHNYDSSGKKLLDRLKIEYIKYNKYFNSKNDTFNISHDEYYRILRKSMKMIIKFMEEDYNTLYIIEGIQIFEWLSPSYIESKPLIIKGTSMINSILNRWKRSGNGKIDWIKELKNQFPRLVSWYIDDTKKLNDFKGSIKENMEGDDIVKNRYITNKSTIFSEEKIQQEDNIIEEAYLLSEGTLYQKKYQCPYCDIRLERQKLVKHVDSKHEDFIPENFTATRVVFNLVNKKEKGTCVICGKETPWDENKAKYDRFDTEKCVQEYIKQRNENMIRTHGKLYVTDDPEFQKKMLANRSISGIYIWSDDAKRTYTGSYEKKLLEFLDHVMGFKSVDVVTPGTTIYYTDTDGKERAWILDVEITPYNLEIDVKDGGDNPNNRDMPEYRAKQLTKEKAIREQKQYNYLRLTNNNFGQLLSTLAQIKLNLLDNNEDKIWNINEYMAMGGVNPMVSGQAETNQESKPIKYIVPAMLQNSFIEPLYSRDEFLEKLYRIQDGKLVLTNKKDISKEFDISNKLLKSSQAEDMKEDLEELLTKESYVDHNIMYQLLTGHRLLDKNQYFFDENLEVELEGLYKSQIKKEIIEATFSNLLNKYKIIISENVHNINYKNLSIQRDKNGFYAYNEYNNMRCKSYESVDKIPEDVLEVLCNY